MKRVVVTGCGVISPVGNEKDSLWDSLTNGKSGVGKITNFDATEFDSKIAGEVKNFILPSHFTSKDQRRPHVLFNLLLKLQKKLSLNLV